MGSPSDEVGGSSLLWQGILVIIVLGLFFAGYRLWYADALRVHYADAFCPQGTWPQEREGVVVPGHTVILIDTSDEITPADAEAAFDRIDAWARDTLKAPFLQKISIYGLPESIAQIPEQSGRSWCVPKPGAMARILYENPRVVEIEFQRFLRRVKSELDSLRQREQAAQSPIAETMAHLVQQHEDLDSFVLVSDMLQHSTLATHYAGDTALTPEARSECEKVSGGGRLRSVWVYYVDRELEVQGHLWPTAWWAECLDGVQAQTLN